jgi:phage shock protein C
MSGYRETNRRFGRRKRSGWGMNLYRNTEDGIIAGVCAGLGDHFEIAHWVMRVIFIGALMFTGPVLFLVYGLCWILLAPRRQEYYEEHVEYDELHRRYRPKNIFRYGADPSTRLARAQERLRDAVRRVEAMEYYVTSRRYEFDREFSRINK